MQESVRTVIQDWDQPVQMFAQSDPKVCWVKSKLPLTTHLICHILQPLANYHSQDRGDSTRLCVKQHTNYRHLLNCVLRRQLYDTIKRSRPLLSGCEEGWGVCRYLFSRGGLLGSDLWQYVSDVHKLTYMWEWMKVFRHGSKLHTWYRCLGALIFAHWL